MGDETPEVKQLVYLITISRVLPEVLGATDLVDISGLTRQQVAECVRNAFDDPLPGPAGGRPVVRPGGIVKKLVVFQEKHVSGEIHFHVALLLFGPRLFAPAKRTLRLRHKLPSHFSCTHTQFWSTVRYGVFPSAHKVEVDQDPFRWTADGSELDLFAESQQPFNAKIWKRRREEADKEAARDAGDPKGKKAKFGKLDLTAIILAKNLRTKTAVLEYTQDHGTSLTQAYVHGQQQKLKESLEDALEWECAREDAKAERESDWELMCRMAECKCKFGEACEYATTAAAIFKANSDVLSKEALAVALRAIVLSGPSKTTRVPLIVGPTNTGKSTLVLPFDKVFGFKHVLHKPALASKFALRNILKEKRFIMWDDYRPVEYGQETVDVPTFLSLFTGFPFEVKMSQAFQDGNQDFQWNRGALMTAKEKGLWKPMGNVTEEDIEHMQSRVDVFKCTAKVPKLKDVEPCPHCMCLWIREAAASHDARGALRALPVLNGTNGAAPSSEDRPAGETKIEGLQAIGQKAKIPDIGIVAIDNELAGLGAIAVTELAIDEWQQLESWATLRPFEQRRFLAALRAVDLV